MRGACYQRKRVTMVKAQKTLDLLRELQSKGFDDSAFALLHHARLRKWRETIKAHGEYCEKIAKNSGEFLEDSENERVQRRLVWVLAKYEKSGRPNGDSAYFKELSDAAFKGLPPKSSRIGAKMPQSRKPR